ncbi:MAG: hypothetical protein HYV63_28980 [Candidatus Schekmanbacteria bacterium]|nr:hypothetical protein [Candidatus Schekmanbacteria bacterium]
MLVTIDGQTVTLSDKNLLGVGGEAQVFSWCGQAVKVYHEGPAPRDAWERSELDERLRNREEKLAAFPVAVPDAVVRPRSLVRDGTAKCVRGYTMALVSGAEDIRRLGQRSWRQGVVTANQVMGTFKAMHRGLSGLHAARVVVGDLNDGNVLFRGADVWFIDADSMQYGGFLCAVAHERFLDPKLYGVDLTKSALFTENTDWYAFAVMLFSSLLYVHPYGGVHKTHHTLLRRAEAGHSVLRPDVTLPKAALHYRVLPDELLSRFEAIFDRGERSRFPESLLELVWRTCRCGLEHARAACPDCAHQHATPPAPALIVRGRCRAASVFAGPGRVCCAVQQGGLRYVVAENGTFRREDGSRIPGDLGAGLPRFAISTSVTWIGKNGRLERFRNGRCEETYGVGAWAGAPMFDASSRTCYRADGEWLIDCLADERIGQILENQTWFRVGETLGFGFYRAGLVTVHFLFHVGRAGLKLVELPPIDGRLLEASAVFDSGRVLFMTATERGGRRIHALHVIDDRGAVLASVSGAPDSLRALATTAGKAIIADRILCSTDDGLLSLEVDASSRTVRERHLFSDTEPFTSEGASLLPLPGGAIAVVSPHAITQLTLMS